ncbi:MAG TPA: SCO family protein, partial [Chloroflexota bacterium]|nr:SCO family protein [Chloroflexota bacterium]
DGPRFELTDHLGRTARSEDLRGRVVVANFVYTNCPDVCPLLSARMQALQTRLREEKLLGDRVQLLSFTVDPARDTPAVLRAYAERYRADPSGWRFLTGPEERLVPLVVDGFHMGVQVLPPTPGAAGHGGDMHEPYEVMHSGRFVLIDRQWRVRAVPDASDFDPDRAVADIRRLLR